MTDFEDVVKSAFAPFELKNDDEHFFTLKGLGVTYGNQDRHGDVMMPGSIHDGLSSRDAAKVLWQHDVNQPIGVGIMTDTQKGAVLSVKLPKDDTFVQGRVLPQIRVGAVNALSIGMRIDHSKSVYKSGVREIHKAYLKEFSVVTFPANTEALIESVKSVGAARDLPLADSDMAWDGDAAVQRVREFTKSKDTPTSEYKKAFLWYDADNADNFTAYKLPFADVVDGEIKAVPAGLSAALGAIRGARGGVKGVSAHDMASIKSVLQVYYSEMGKPNPFTEKKYDIGDVKKFVAIRDFEDCLRESGIFSKDAATYLAKCFDLSRRESALENPTTQALEFKQLLEKIRGTANV